GGGGGRPPAAPRPAGRGHPHRVDGPSGTLTPRSDSAAGDGGVDERPHAPGHRRRVGRLGQGPDDHETGRPGGGEAGGGLGGGAAGHEEGVDGGGGGQADVVEAGPGPPRLGGGGRHGTDAHVIDGLCSRGRQFGRGVGGQADQGV